MWTSSFWLDAGERAIKSFAQGILVGLGGDGAGLVSLNWGDTLEIAVGMALASVLTSIVSARGGTAQAIVNTYNHDE